MAESRRRGRPEKEKEVKPINFHIEKDLYEWVCQNRGSKSRTAFINDIIRKEAGL